MRDNMTTDRSCTGKYTTHILTERAEQLIGQHNPVVPMFLYFAHLAAHAGNFDEPLQAPKESIEMFSHIKSMEKKTYAGKLKCKPFYS